MSTRLSIPFYTEDGEQVEFYCLEQTMIQGVTYLLVEEAQAGDDGVVYMMKGEGEDPSGDYSTFTFVEEEEELLSVMKVFEQLLDGTDLMKDF